MSFDGRRVSILPGALLILLLWTSASGTTTAPRVATPAPPGTAEELGAVVEQARLSFVAKDAAGVLAHLADNYRSGRLTKPDVRQQLLARTGRRFARASPINRAAPDGRSPRVGRFAAAVDE